MDKTVFCKISVMLRDNLPNDFGYQDFIEEIAKMLGLEMQIFNSTPPGMSDEQIATVPVPISRAIGTNNDVEMQISSNNFIYVFKRKIISLEEIGNVIETISNGFSTVGKDYALRYRLGIILNIITNRKTLEGNVKDVATDNFIRKPEWQLSYLEKSDCKFGDNELAINKWKYYICNDETEVFKHDLDINTSIVNSINIRDNLIKNVYIDFMKQVIEDAYNEFK